MFQNAETPHDVYNMIIDYFKGNAKYCEEFIGEGAYGTVTTPHGIGKKILVPLPFGNVNLDVIVKSGWDTKSDLFIEEQDGFFLISSTYNNLIMNAILFSLLSRFWYDGRNPHVPFVVSAFSCNDKPVTKMIMEKNYFCDDILFDRNQHSIYFLNDKPLKILKMIDLEFILITKGKPDPVAFADYLFVSMAYTMYMAWKEFKIVIHHFGSVHIGIQSTDSYWGKGSLKSVKHMSYKINDKYLTLPNFGIVPKLMPINYSITPLPNCLISTDGQGLDKPVLSSLIGVIKSFLTHNQFKLTCAYSVSDSVDILETLSSDVFSKYITDSVPKDGIEIKK